MQNAICVLTSRGSRKKVIYVFQQRLKLATGQNQCVQPNGCNENAPLSQNCWHHSSSPTCFLSSFLDLVLSVSVEVQTIGSSFTSALSSVSDNSHSDMKTMTEHDIIKEEEVISAYITACILVYLWVYSIVNLNYADYFRKNKDSTFIVFAERCDSKLLFWIISRS